MPWSSSDAMVRHRHAKCSEFGANLISGLVSDITSCLGAVQDAIANVASNTVDCKEKLGIHSPSRVFGELGGFITQGALAPFTPPLESGLGRR
jgi:hypothetical protein